MGIATQSGARVDLAGPEHLDNFGNRQGDYSEQALHRR
jgi:hypothetical protein